MKIQNFSVHKNFPLPVYTDSLTACHNDIIGSLPVTVAPNTREYQSDEL